MRRKKKTFLIRFIVPILLFVSYLILSDFAPVLLPLAIWSLGLVLFISVFQSRKRIRFMWLVGPLSFVILLLSIEVGLRFEPFSYRFLPMNTGKNFSAHPFLFWKGSSWNDNSNGEAPLYPNKVKPKSGAEDLKLDEIGFRSGPANKLKKKGVFRIVTMGGSNAWGFGIVKYTDTFSGRLDAMFQKAYPSIKIEIISAGFSGYVLFQNLVLYKLFIRQYDPDLIILYGNINDIQALQQLAPFSYRELFKMRSGVDISDLWITEQTFPKTESVLLVVQDAMKQSRLYNFLTDNITDLRINNMKNFKQNGHLKPVNPVSDYRKNLIDLITIVHKDNVKIICADEFFLDEKTFTTDSYDPPDSIINTTMKEVSISMGVTYVPVFDILCSREDHNELVLSYDRTHINEKGHDALAKILFEVMEKNGILEKAEKINTEENSPPIGIPISYSF